MAAWQVNGERTRPHCIMVNRQGRRFTNEAANYNALGAAFHVIDVSSFDYVNHPAWMIFDRHYADPLRAGRLQGRGGHAGLDDRGADAGGARGQAIDVPADALERHGRPGGTSRPPTARTPTSAAARARTTGGGATQAGARPAATLGPLDTPPFYAVQVYAGVLGTKGGPRTDGNGQVLDVDGNPIPGLYAAGNAMASVMGMTYGGAGGTLGRRSCSATWPGRTRRRRRAHERSLRRQGRARHRRLRWHGPGDGAAFAAAGAQVVAADIAVDGGEETVGLIKGDGGEAFFVRTDVSQARDVEAAVAAVETSAGWTAPSTWRRSRPRRRCSPTATRTRSTAWSRSTCKSIFLCLKYEIRAMLERGGGSIVNIASTNSCRPLPKQAVYTRPSSASSGSPSGRDRVRALRHPGQRGRPGRDRHPHAARARSPRAATGGRGGRPAEPDRAVRAAREIASACCRCASADSTFTIGACCASTGAGAWRGHGHAAPSATVTMARFVPSPTPAASATT